MIVRMWRGPVPKAKQAAYVDYLKQTGLNDYQKIAGNRGVYLLTRDLGDQVEFLTMTFWDSIEAVKGSPLSLKKMEIAQQVGLVLLMGLMVFALFNDVTRLIFGRL